MKQEKRDEKRLNKERKLEQRRLELEMAKELKKPNEDMCLADQKVIYYINHFYCLFPPPLITPIPSSTSTPPATTRLWSCL